MPTDSRRILVLRYRFIGDTILTVPFLRNLRRAEPGAHIAWVVAPGSADVIRGVPYVDELIFWDPVTIHADSRGTHRTLADKWRFIRGLRQRSFDTVYVLKRSFGSALMALLTGASRRVGFDTEGRGFLLTKRVAYCHDRHEVENFLAVLKADGIPVLDDHLEAWLSDDERQCAEQFFADAGIGADEPVIGIHPFAANRPRSWHRDNFIDLANRLRAAHHARIIIFGGGKDRQEAGAFLTGINGPPVDAIGRTTLRETMALLARCRLLVCNDSGIMHLAAALQVPLVALFGPQSPVKFGPWGKTSRVIYSRFPCSPCRQKFFTECEPSPRGVPLCMEDIEIEQVFDAASALLTQNGA